MFAAILTALCLGVAPSATAGTCSSGGYAYAGLQSSHPAHGIAATLSALGAPRVENGHVAGWVGVGGHGLGPGGTDEWIQVGLAAFPGSASRLYYEVKRPGRPARYVEILRPVRSGERHRVMVLETSGARGWWQVRVDGLRVGRPVFLPGSHGRWYPIATAESWSGGALACNGFRYRFELVALAAEPGRSWQAFSGGYVLRDSPYRLVRRGASSFLALAR